MSARRMLAYLFDGPWPLTFAMMGVFGGLFGLVTANFAMRAHANLEFLIGNGVWGLSEGGGAQALELIALGYLALALYILFKGCLYGLLGRFQKH